MGGPYPAGSSGFVSATGLKLGPDGLASAWGGPRAPALGHGLDDEQTSAPDGVQVGRRHDRWLGVVVGHFQDDLRPLVAKRDAEASAAVHHGVRRQLAHGEHGVIRVAVPPGEHRADEASSRGDGSDVVREVSFYRRHGGARETTASRGGIGHLSPQLDRDPGLPTGRVPAVARLPAEKANAKARTLCARLMLTGRTADDKEAAVVLAVCTQSVHDDLNDSLGGLLAIRRDESKQLIHALVKIGFSSLHHAVGKKHESLARSDSDPFIARFPST